MVLLFRYLCSLHLLILSMHCSCNFIQLHLPSSWIKLCRTVHQQGTWKPAFLPAQLLWIFDIFDTSLPACLSPEMLCSVLTSKLFFHQCPSFPYLSQCLSNDSSELCLPGAPNLPFSQLQSSAFHPTQSPFSSSALPVTAQTITHHWEHHSCPGLPLSPASASSRVLKKPSQNHTELAKNPSRLRGQENKTFPRKSG